MTKEEILAMEAGQELDKLIAENIFSFEVAILGEFQGKPIYHYLADIAYGEVWDHLPKYSTDRLAAQQMEDKVIGLGLQGIYGKNLILLTDDQGDANMKAFALAHASSEIRCKAALLAKLEGGDVFHKNNTK